MNYSFSFDDGRVITYETIITTKKQNVLFAIVYDKSEYPTIDLNFLKKNLGL